MFTASKHIPKTDTDLVLQALHDPSCFGELVERYSDKLLRYVRRICYYDEQICQDLLQEAFIKMYQNLASYSSDFPFSSWAYRVVRNHVISYQRKHAVSDVSLDAESGDHAKLLDILSSGEDVALGCESEDTQKRIWEVLQKLPDRYKEVLVLYFLEEKKYEEISDILKKPTSTVGTLMSRAKKVFAREARKIGVIFS